MLKATEYAERAAAHEAEAEKIMDCSPDLSPIGLGYVGAWAMLAQANATMALVAATVEAGP